ncbi:ABC transporter ATP-binding protein [Rhizobium sp. 1AS11]|uniref:ABC transporter ATP-binding protein n=1 Tax=Rhizobium acaciae TaxID=2989736 RepID=UPI002221645F|nr:ABC transporter ATP-binding protein [Rhizobium acaciae]MCW1413811.1 ABC transporter ATP-binding protein [Rhizobium acaciae]MCW1745948.1 ABC transporter ATP-binding protein [Rhizobium acaciae]
MSDAGFSSCPSIETRGFGKSVQVRLASKFYGDFAALKDVTLTVNPGEFLTLLGPSGSGKTTTMMAIAGFTELSSGAILIDENRIDHLPPNRRNIGVVFQHLALFPHMSVADNVAFPLRMRGVPEDKVRLRVRRVLELVELPTFGERLPSQLSGGQQQRVAFARAVVFDPPVLLLDEPLGALDRKLRENMQAELKRLQRQLGITTIMVTHDQEEALTVSDRIAVMSNGQLEQIGSPEELYQYPATPFVADFVGDSNRIVGTVRTVAGDTCTIVTAGAIECIGKKRNWDDASVAALVVRPERVLVGREVGAVANRFNGVIENVNYAGDSIKYVIRISREDTLVAKVRNAPHHSRLHVGEATVVGWGADDAVVFTPANSLGDYRN